MKDALSWFLLCAITLETNPKDGLRAISCQAGKLPERKDIHRKPLLPHLRVS